MGVGDPFLEGNHGSSASSGDFHIGDKLINSIVGVYRDP